MNEMRKLLETLSQINEMSSPNEEEEIIYALEEALVSFKDQIGDIKEMLRSYSREDSAFYGRARYWIAAIETALDKDNEWMGGNMFTMQDTIDELRNSAEREFDSDYDDDDMGELADDVREGYGDNRAVMIDGKEVDMQSLQFAGVSFRDAPDFADAYVEFADFVDGTPLSHDQIETLENEYVDEVRYRLERHIY